MRFFQMIFSFILACIVIALSFLFYNLYLKEYFFGSPDLVIGQTKFEIYAIADNEAKRTKGLSGVLPIKDNQAMLFVFERTTTPTFWMKDMLFPIDIVWVSNGKIIGINKSLQPLNYNDNPVYYTPPEPVNQVVELLAGTVDKYQLKIGDLVKFDK